MLVVHSTLEGVSPLTWGGAIQSEKKSGEPHDEFEERTWRERAHGDIDGNAFLAPMSIKLCVDAMAKYLSESVPGAGSSKFTKHFVSGVKVFAPLLVTDLNGKNLKVAELHKYRMFVPSDGVRGGGKRVWRNYPTAMQWRTQVELYVLDPKIDAERVKRYLTESGKFIGLGSFRSENQGYHGMFKVVEFSAEKKEE